MQQGRESSSLSSTEIFVENPTRLAVQKAGERVALERAWMPLVRRTLSSFRTACPSEPGSQKWS